MDNKGNLEHTECKTDTGFVTEDFIVVDVHHLMRGRSSIEIVTCAECSGPVSLLFLAFSRQPVF